MRDILLIIDMQNDFITGALGTSEAEAGQGHHCHPGHPRPGLPPDTGGPEAACAPLHTGYRGVGPSP